MKEDSMLNKPLRLFFSMVVICVAFGAVVTGVSYYFDDSDVEVKSIENKDYIYEPGEEKQ